MKKLTFGLFLCFFIPFCAGCAALHPEYEAPVVSVTSFRAIPGPGMAPEFEIGLHIVNPNRSDLGLVGITYTISIENHKIFTGVSNDLPGVPGYGEEDIRLKGSLNLLASLGLFTDLFKNRSDERLGYTLDIKLDTGGFRPLIRLSKKGEFFFPTPGRAGQ